MSAVRGRDAFSRIEEMSETERRLFVKSLLLAIYVKLLVRFGSFSDLRRLARSAVSVTTSIDRELCLTAERAVHRAWRVSPWRGRCLEIALTLALVLRDEGARAEVQLGVAGDREDFAAHAWVEVPSCGYSARCDEKWHPLGALR